MVFQADDRVRIKPSEHVPPEFHGKLAVVTSTADEWIHRKFDSGEQPEYMKYAMQAAFAYAEADVVIKVDGIEREVVLNHEDIGLVADEDEVDELNKIWELSE